MQKKKIGERNTTRKGIPKKDGFKRLSKHGRKEALRFMEQLELKEHGDVLEISHPKQIV